jgi:hypothetical protein
LRPRGKRVTRVCADNPPVEMYAASIANALATRYGSPALSACSSVADWIWGATRDIDERQQGRHGGIAVNPQQRLTRQLVSAAFFPVQTAQPDSRATQQQTNRYPGRAGPEMAD